MTKLKLRKLSNCRIQVGIVICAALAPIIWAQASRQLQVEVGTNQQVSILASGVSYGEVLKTLQEKLAWEIEIPPIANELKVSYMRVEGTQPQIALAKLLEGSRLGYAFLGAVSGSRRMKVIVIPLDPRQAKVTRDTASSPPVPDNGEKGVSLPPPAQAQAATISRPNAPATETAPEVPPAPSTMPLVDVVNIIGVPPGVSPADVGKAMTFSISEAARIMGFPPGISPTDVGKTITMPLPSGPGKRP